MNTNVSKGNLIGIAALSLSIGLLACSGASGQTDSYTPDQARNDLSSAGDTKDGKFLRSNVIYNEDAPSYRLSRTKPSAAPSAAPAAGAGGYQTPTADQGPSVSEKPKPVAEKEEAQQLLRESFEATINACNNVILTAVLAGQMSVPEELQVRSELDKLKALNKDYAAKGYTAATFREMQLKFVNLQLLIYQYGTNAQTR